MTFPDHRFRGIADFTDRYFERVAHAASSLDRAELERAASVLLTAYRSGRTVFVCGNGGSAAIANHLACDHLKSVQTDTALCPRVVSLSANLELVSAIANDISFDEVFVYQLRTLASPEDVLVSVSSSGDSENVVRAVAWARDHEVTTIALSGFSGGRTRELADVRLHVDADNYGVSEDVHQSIMHVLAQYLRLDHMPEELARARNF